MKKFPTLYLKNDNNRIRFWKIWVTNNKKDNIAYIYKEYGLLGGKITSPKPKEVKHKGTISSYQKAVTAATYKYNQKIEKGFSTNKNKVSKKEDIILPMGAHKIDDQKHKIVYPALIQRKLDGFRCMSHIKNGEVELLSRTGKNFHHLEDIRDEINQIKLMRKNSNIYLDGELYIHDLPLRKLSSIVSKKYINDEDKKRMKMVQYNIFDMFDVNKKNLIFSERFNIVKDIFKKHKFKYLKLVNVETVKKYKDIEKKYDQFISEGYEGIIVRNKQGVYKFNKKSYDVLRTKEFKKGEFIIIGGKQGAGEQKGAIIWHLECNKNKKKSFWGIPIGSLKERQKLYKNYKKYIGKTAIVKYWDIDKDGCVIRNPIVEKIL